MTEDALLFFQKMPQVLPVYDALLETLQARYPDMRIRVTKTQISFANRHIFAMVSLPWRRVKGWPEEFLLVSFGLSYQEKSSRIVQAVEAYPNRWTHHVLLARPEEVDEELLCWLDQAYHFSMAK